MPIHSSPLPRRHGPRRAVGPRRTAGWVAAVSVALLTVGACAAAPATEPAAELPAAAVPAAAPQTAAGGATAVTPTTQPRTPPSSRPSPAPIGSAGAGTPAGTARCPSTQLSVAVGPAEGAAGSVTRPLVFTNTGRRPCELRGFPGVSYVTGDGGQQVGPAAVMSGSRGPQVVLAAGGRAVAELQLVQVQNFDPAMCQPTAVRGLRVYPPGDTASLFAPLESTGCAGTPPGPQIQVRSISSA